MADPLMSEIRTFAFNFPPRGWATCSGQLLAINTNQALFALLGTTYGGNGQTTFALPDLRGRTAMHFGTNVMSGTFSLGQVGGQEFHTLIQSEMPAHNHTVNASTTTANETYPAPTNLWAAGASEPGYASTANAVLSPATVGISGGSQPHENRHPFLVMNFCICLQGIFPSRN
jgi:microcystin-dependent protein